MAVYTHVSPEALTVFLRDFDVGRVVRYDPIAEGIENSNFKLSTASGLYILTLFEKRVDPADLPWFLGLMQHLVAQGFPCPLPVPAKDGIALRQLCNRPAMLTTFLQGRWERVPSETACMAVGETLARLHQAGAGYAPTRRNALGSAGWAPLLAACGDGPDLVQPGLKSELDAALARIVPHWPGALPCGHIHADLFPDNLFFLNGMVSGVIDFMFAATDLLAYDIAICLNAWCFDPDGAFHAARSRALIAGYERHRPLLPAERAALPLLCQGAALRFLLTRLYDWMNTPADALVIRKDPHEYLRKLRFHFASPEVETYVG